MAEVPESITKLLATLNFREKTNDFGIRTWITTGPDNPFKGVNYLLTWEKHYQKIISDGGTCILLLLPNTNSFQTEAKRAIEINYPVSHAYMNFLIEKIGFGLSGFGELAQGKGYLRTGMNSEERVLERRTEALKIIKGMQAEARVVLTQLVETKATIKMPGSHDQKFLEKWGMQVWEFYKNFYQTDVDIHPVHSFTRSDCLRLAKKFGSFNLGGWG